MIVFKYTKKIVLNMYFCPRQEQLYSNAHSGCYNTIRKINKHTDRE